MTMTRTALVMAYLACIGQGRRVQNLENLQRSRSTDPAALAEVKELQEELHEPETAIGPLGSLRTLRTLLSALHQTAAFNPSGAARSPISLRDRHVRPAGLGTQHGFGRLGALVSMDGTSDDGGLSARDASADLEFKRECYEFDVQNRGFAHPTTISSLLSYAAAFGQAESPEKAEPVWKDALEKAHRFLGPQHPEAVQAFKMYEDLYGTAQLDQVVLKAVAQDGRLLPYRSKALSEKAILDESDDVEGNTDTSSLSAQGAHKTEPKMAGPAKKTSTPPPRPRTKVSNSNQFGHLMTVEADSPSKQGKHGFREAVKAVNRLRLQPDQPLAFSDRD